MDRAFDYDPLYRLLSATGRECDTPPPIPSGHPWDDRPRGVDPTRTRPYQQQYEYDPVGNLLRLSHTHFPVGNTGNTVNRRFEIEPNSNRLRTVTVGSLPFAYAYDANGNLVQQNTERRFGWDHADRMITFINQPDKPEGLSPPSVEACYLYGADGIRVKKWVRKNGNGDAESTVYIDDIFEYHRWGGVQLRENKNNRLHVMDNQNRVALIRVGDKHDDGGGPDIQYHLGDHLGSSNLVIGGAAATADEFINREEYYPYGETSFGSFSRKRYRFTGKERDEESGFYYHGARYYVPWLARWLRCDPIWNRNGASLYQYGGNNPLRFQDRTGALENEPQSQQRTEIGGALHGAKVVAPGPNKNTVVRRDNPVPDPEKFGMKPTDPKSKLTSAEHALNEHLAGPNKKAPSPYLSASRLPKGAGFEGEAFWIDIDRAKQAGVEFIDHNELVNEMENLAAAKPELAERVESWKRHQSTDELEVLFKGDIPASAIESRATRRLKYFTKGLSTAGQVVTAYDLCKAGLESSKTGSLRPFAEEGVRQVGGWAGAVVGGKAGAAVGAVFGIKTGPGAVATSTVWCPRW